MPKRSETFEKHFSKASLLTIEDFIALRNLFIFVTTQVDRLKVPRNAGLGKSAF